MSTITSMIRKYHVCVDTLPGRTGEGNPILNPNELRSSYTQELWVSYNEHSSSLVMLWEPCQFIRVQSTYSITSLSWDTENPLLSTFSVNCSSQYTHQLSVGTQRGGKCIKNPKFSKVLVGMKDPVGLSPFPALGCNPLTSLEATTYGPRANCLFDLSPNPDSYVTGDFTKSP